MNIFLKSNTWIGIYIYEFTNVVAFELVGLSNTMSDMREKVEGHVNYSVQNVIFTKVDSYKNWS